MMNRLRHQIAARTGESLAVIRRLGFQIKAVPHDEPVVGDLCLVVHCPFCRGSVPYPGRSRDGSPTLAECEACDVYFEFEDHDVYPARTGRDVEPPPARRRYVPA